MNLHLILVIKETKIDSTITEAKFYIPGCKNLIARIKKPWQGIIVQVREDIPSRSSFKIDLGKKRMIIVINLRKSKWQVLATYKSPDHSKE